MELLGNRILDENGATGKRVYGIVIDLQSSLGFHQRPWHSISHLHLHCIELPYKNCFAKFSHSFPFLVSTERVRKWIQFPVCHTKLSVLNYSICKNKNELITFQSSEKRVDKQETTEQLSTKRLQIAYPVIRSFRSICRIVRIML